MKITLIAAMDRNNVIGYKGKMPWHLPADLKRFKALTMFSPIIMGRKTYESIGKPLPNRINIIVTHDKTYQAAGCSIVNTVGQALAVAAASHTTEVFIIGGESLYTDLMPLADTLYITIIDRQFEGDTFFPIIDARIWEEVDRVAWVADTSINFRYTFLTYNRR